MTLENDHWLDQFRLAAEQALPGSDLSVACDSCTVNKKIDFEKGSESCQGVLKCVYSLNFRYWVLEPEIAAILLLCELLRTNDN